jgi:predicted O-methyltransferase YrrM
VLTRPLRLRTRARLLLHGFRYAGLMPYVSIDGWLEVDEAIALYELARLLPEENAVAVEIGSWQGKSSVCIGRGLLGKRSPRLVCIDPFDASGDQESTGEYGDRAARVDNQLRASFERNLARAGVLDLVEVRQGLSHEVAATFAGGIDLLFLDGDHGYEAVLRDYGDWAPKIRPGGCLAMHDVLHAVHEGPRRVVDEVVRADPAWIEPRYVGSMFVARRART